MNCYLFRVLTLTWKTVENSSIFLCYATAYVFRCKYNFAYIYNFAIPCDSVKNKMCENSASAFYFGQVMGPDRLFCVNTEFDLNVSWQLHL